MENTKLLRLLRTFQREELTTLIQFVKSPYFNNRKEAVVLMEILAKALQESRKFPTRAQVFRQVFGKDAYDDHRLRMAMSFLYQLSWQFMAVHHFLHKKELFHYQVARGFRERRLFSDASRALQIAQVEQARHPFRDASFFEEQYQVALEQYRNQAEISQAQAIDLSVLSDQLDHAFLARKFWQACFMLSYQRIHNTQYDFGLLEVLIQYVAARPALLETPAIGLYYHCYLTLTNPSKHIHFQQFKALLLHNGSCFTPVELRDIYVLAINFCIRQYNAGNNEYLQEQYDFYKIGLENGYFITEGILSHYTYQNAATIGLVMNQLTWVEEIVHRYQPNLSAAHREGVFYFNLARLEYKRNHLDKALVHLQKAEYKDILLNLAAKTLQIKIFYALEEFDLLESHLQAFRVFLDRKKMISYHRENYLNTVIFMQKIIKTNLKNKQDVAALRAEITQTTAVAERDWLLAQL